MENHFLRIHKYIYNFISFSICITFGLVILLSKSEVAAKLQLLHSVKSENERLSSDIKNLRSISEKLIKLRSYLNTWKIWHYHYNIRFLYLKNNEKKL